jgi:hypothetical protein
MTYFIQKIHRQLLRANAPPINGPATPAADIVMPMKVEMKGSRPGGEISGYTIIVYG